MSIRLTIDRAEPLTGSAEASTGAAIRFLGWMDLLKAVSELVGAADRAQAGRPNATDTATTRTEGR